MKEGKVLQGLGALPGGDDDDNSKPGFFWRIGIFFNSLFGGSKGSGITTTLPGATIIKKGVQVGPIERIDPYVFDRMAWVKTDGPIRYVGGAGDPFGIYEVGGMALTANSDEKTSLFLAALLITKGGNTGGLKMLSAGKGAFQNIFESQIDDLVKLNNNKNSVTIGTTGGAFHYDLRGATHKGIETPHIQRSFINTNNNGQTFLNKDRKWVQPMTQQDIRTVRNYLNKK